MRFSPIALSIVALASLNACTQSGTVTNSYGDSSSSSDTTAMSSDATMTNTSSTMSAPADTSTTSMAANSNTAWDGKYLTGKHTVTLKTSKGDITLELDADAAPKTVTNFITLAKDGYYNNLTFHRVIPGFMIQGGDPSGNGTGGASIYGDTFADEINPSSNLYQVGYKKGVIAMANRGPNTNGSQFFIMETDYPLPPSYTIFGHVTSGQDVVSAIAASPRGANDMPSSPISFSAQVKN